MTIYEITFSNSETTYLEVPETQLTEADILQILLNKRYDPRKVTNSGNTIIHQAA